ncbi:hypothetical protein BST27_05715 [Mycobacterium intermedium]|uniref:DUF1028 domain-containing protein n=1 Tax=Mycobacterium intermedium TaxID=28445 RepID=A0A1E3S7J1_MYCIE|nr:DUF1028 domain-containing protein [Mycobacterium intermedium]MCV6963610.1 DUF1028 domain-containing protein [Mycobacterium intermedium]ODQ97612.1 hypothetical protein BHQ20_26030 [Mycobacterium intermedium]OPE46963.1 hypothetical protein BV508_23925 [Mycobacterium intermedium]ORB09618.1 hypothetical protein BST27_05715 [Mycobacterium intermedium]
MTFSLLARDAATGQLGVASQSHYLGVGSVVTWAEAGVGVVATQAFALRSYGPRGLALMRAGFTPGDALDQLLDEDTHPEVRQVAFLDAEGRIGIHCGRRCVGAFGVAVGDQAVALGNMLDNDDVVSALLRGHEDADGDLSHRLVAGLTNAENAGGDIRGSQSAALLVVAGRGGSAGGDAPWDGVIRDLRVEDHSDPVGELSRLVSLSDGFDRMSRVVFDPDGAVVGERRCEQGFGAGAGELAYAARALDSNPEATFWSAVLHARWGRTESAQRLFSAASQLNPRLGRFVGQLGEAGILTPDEVARLRDAGR